MTDSWKTKRYSRTDAGAMMCLMDAWCGLEEPANASHVPEWLREFRGNHGSFALRQMLEQIAPAVGKLWDSMSDAKRNSYIFDWEFCPDVILHGIDIATLDVNMKVKLFKDAGARILAHRAVHTQFANRKVA